jgi:hypothetical protein
MGALKEYHWDAKGNTYGSLSNSDWGGGGDYIGGDTFIMDHGRACFSLLKHEAAVWTTYDGHGQLLGESVHTAGTVYGGTKLVVAALWALRGFNRPTGIDKQTRLIAKGAHRAVYCKELHAATTATALLLLGAVLVLFCFLTSPHRALHGDIALGITWGGLVGDMGIRTFFFTRLQFTTIFTTCVEHGIVYLRHVGGWSHCGLFLPSARFCAGGPAARGPFPVTCLAENRRLLLKALYSFFVCFLCRLIGKRL